MLARRLSVINQSSHQPPGDVVHLQTDVARSSQLVADGCGGVEGVGVAGVRVNDDGGFGGITQGLTAKVQAEQS